jgi:hypothetical protein
MSIFVYIITFGYYVDGSLCCCWHHNTKMRLGHNLYRKLEECPKVLVLEQNWRQIIVQAFFQIFVMFMMMFLGAQIFFAGKSINLITAKSHVLDDNGDL